ncbi:S-layer homology domain-containing protein [Paenibacillus sp. WQ 127069]|uniref:S-layer homology domain-containing protein n=1 Tax=Paenibacillus baimaensis TaxID=2982185 RepID=A0ABT2UEQ7_9BACL|nr:S-layer homology domain-containing protein [Paenibacillus sp. WQ 127069]MCU6793090.1 S-layer homology domain-containing protein [Paenibacillus sp. WQ 127069]
MKHANVSADQFNNLSIYVEHNDGTKELLKGTLVPYHTAGDLGLQFVVNQFSTFTMVQLPSAVQHHAYIQGYAEGLFKPENKITRAEMAAILARIVSKDENGAEVAYTDVKADYWASQAIARVSKLDLMKGYADGTFRSDQIITRAEMASIIARLLGPVTLKAAAYSDVAKSWAQADIDKASSAGIISGYTDGTFKPENGLTRAEAVTMINRYLGRGPLTGVPTPTWKDVPTSYWGYNDIEEASLEHAFTPKADGGEQYAPISVTP